MNKLLMFGVGVIVGALVVLSIPLVLAHNEDSILARLQRLEDKLKYYEDRIKVTDDGKFGIGTNSPDRKLHVRGEVLLLDSPKPDSPAYIGFNNNEKGTAFIGTMGPDFDCYGGAGSFNIVLNGKNFPERMRSRNATDCFPVLIAKPDGKIGIGTENPQATLDVNGDVKASRIVLEPWKPVVFANGWRNTKGGPLPAITEMLTE